MRALVARVAPSAGRAVDLLVLLLVILAIHPVVPVGHLLARNDLIPWITGVLSAAAFLRGASLGSANHPSLVPREGGFLARQAARMVPPLAPVVLFAWYEVGHLHHWVDLAAAVGISVGATLVLAISRGQGVTAWEPPGISDVLVWVLRVVPVVTLCVGLGAFSWLFTDVAGVEIMRWGPASTLVGLQYVATGWVNDPPRNGRQRRASGQRDGRPYRQSPFRYLLALLGPSTGLLALAVLHALFIGPLTYSHGVVVAIHLLAWAAVLWPLPYPVAVQCVLHEVVPAGGVDGFAGLVATPFDAPPLGALRLNPRNVRRLRVIHPWVVPVQDPRLERLDDPVRLLWPDNVPYQPYHVLGPARFEPDAATQMPQWETITIRLSDVTDIGRLTEGNAQQRRLVVLRAFAPPGGFFRRAVRTYRWQRAVPEGCLQIVDATTQQLVLIDGDVIVLSSEGVARAFELEVGAPIFAHDELSEQRPAQLEDYVGLPS